MDVSHAFYLTPSAPLPQLDMTQTYAIGTSGFTNVHDGHTMTVYFVFTQPASFDAANLQLTNAVVTSSNCGTSTGTTCQVVLTPTDARQNVYWVLPRSAINAVGSV